MGGLVLDIFFEYFFRSAWISMRRMAASSRPVIDATVIESRKRDFGFGRTVILIRYRYRNGEERFEATHKEPFLFDNFAAAYLNRFPGGSAFPVRVNPKDFSKCMQAELPTFQRM